MPENRKDTFQNPFVLNRAEQMGNALHEYFVADGLENLLSNKPLVLQGGRGCGKTMFLMYHSYWSKKSEYVDRSSDLSDLLQQEEIIGVYYRADSLFVTAFQHKNLSEQNWSNVFAHYFNLQIAAQILDIIVDLKRQGIKTSSEGKICQRLCLYLRGVQNQPSHIEELLQTIEQQKACVVMYINNVGKEECPSLIPPGILINELVTTLYDEPVFQGKVFHIFVDEYETLLDYQQVLINTFVKCSKPPLVYDIGVRKKGLRRRETLAPNEAIGEPHDYKLFDLEDAIGKNYGSLLKKVCLRRLRQTADLKNRPEDDKWLQIESYLGSYSLDDEMAFILRDHPSPEFLGKLSARILENIGNRKDLRVALKRLADPSRPILSRLNLALLERNKPPSVGELIAELDKYDAGKPSKYQDWLHNNEMGLLFLLCHEQGERKRYYGFDVFSFLSSGIIRYFLELCEHAFQNAHYNLFSFEQPRELTVNEMDAAAHHVSRYKFNDIETYPPYGPQLKRFILLLGGIFSALHKDPKQSETERNHFHTRMDEISEKGRAMLDSAVMWTVLQERSPTKLKEPQLSYEEIDYHLNRIYAPLFQISYRQKKKLFIPSANLNNMLEKPMRIGQESAREVLKRHDVQEADLSAGQLELWSMKRHV